MDPTTAALHESIDGNIRRLRRGYLSSDGESVTVDLLGSAPMVKWQEEKAAATFLGSLCWSELPQVYGRYGGESSRELVQRIKALESAAAAVVTDSGMAAIATLFDALLEPGDQAIVARSLYNKTNAYLAWLEKRAGITFTLLEDGEVESFPDRVTARTRIVSSRSTPTP
jgi:cystathionine beta-lyase/cystathionine gamma-synthase